MRLWHVKLDLFISKENDSTNACEGSLCVTFGCTRYAEHIVGECFNKIVLGKVKVTLTKKQIEQINQVRKKVKTCQTGQKSQLMKLSGKLESESVTTLVNEYISNMLTDMFFPVEFFC